MHVKDASVHVSDLVGNSEDLFSHVAAQILSAYCTIMMKISKDVFFNDY